MMISYTGLYAQLKSVSPEKLQISFDKTLHIIFSDNINYYEKGSESIAIDVDPSSKNILRIKANEEDFPGETNISVVLANGDYHTYDVAYSSNIITTSYRASKDTINRLVSDPISVNTTKNTHLIFPSEIKYIDFGNNEAISVDKAQSTKNILRLKGINHAFPETSLSVVTNDNQYYSYNVSYAENPSSHTYKIGNTDNLALFEKPNTDLLEDLCKNINNRSAYIYDIGLQKTKMSFLIKGIYIKNNILYVQAELENSSTINYNIDFLKFVIKDKKQRKNTSVQEEEIQTLYNYNVPTVIKGKEKKSFVIALPKFTIPDAKVCIISLFEKEGGRHLEFNLSNSNIINAQPF